MRKLVSLLLAVALLMSMAAGFAFAEEAEVPTIKVIMSPWVSTPAPAFEEDPYNQFLNNTYGANFELITTSDFTTEVTLAFTSGNEPDLIIFNSMTDLNMLYDEGVLLEDWTPFIDKLPQTYGNLSDTAIAYLTNDDGKLTAMPTMAGDQLWAFYIRKDWLANLNLEMPTDVNSLLDVARAFTFNDPDGNGADDTWGFTSSGSGTSIGELTNFQWAFGQSQTSFYIGEDGAVSHPLLDGAYKEFCDFLKTVVDEKLIDPDWYTQGWDERKPNLFQGKFGIVYYPAEALLTETNEGRGNDGLVKDWYQILMLDGMKLGAEPVVGTVRSVSASCAEDPAKMEAICKLFEGTALYNEDYYRLRYGYEIDDFIMIDMGGGSYYLNKSDTSAYHAGSNTNYGYLWNWGRICCSYADGYLGGAEPEPSDIIYQIADMNGTWFAQEHASNEYRLLNPDPTIADESSRLISEFTVNYVLGNTDDYDGFVAEWLDAVGEDLKDDATETFTKYGLIQ